MWKDDGSWEWLKGRVYGQAKWWGAPPKWAALLMKGPQCRHDDGQGIVTVQFGPHPTGTDGDAEPAAHYEFALDSVPTCADHPLGAL
jgi:hypothetical protein